MCKQNRTGLKREHDTWEGSVGTSLRNESKMLVETSDQAIGTAFLYTAGRLFNYYVIDSHAAGYNSNKQNDPIDDALRGHHALASLPAGV